MELDIGKGVCEMQAEEILAVLLNKIKNSGSGGSGNVTKEMLDGTVDAALKLAKDYTDTAVSGAGYSLGLNIDSDYIMTLELKNADGIVVSAKSVDFPIENVVVGASYADRIVTLSLQNGDEINVDVSDLVNGLVNDNFTIAGIDMKDDITANDLKYALGINDLTNTIETFAKLIPVEETLEFSIVDSTNYTNTVTTYIDIWAVKNGDNIEGIIPYSKKLTVFIATQAIDEPIITIKTNRHMILVGSITIGDDRGDYPKITTEVNAAGYGSLTIRDKNFYDSNVGAYIELVIEIALI